MVGGAHCRLHLEFAHGRAGDPPIARGRIFHFEVIDIIIVIVGNWDL